MDAEHEAFLRALTRERFTHVPQATGPVEGPTSRQMQHDRWTAIETAHRVVDLPRHMQRWANTPDMTKAKKETG